jgi:hypothetical protein
MSSFISNITLTTSDSFQLLQYSSKSLPLPTTAGHIHIYVATNNFLMADGFDVAFNLWILHRVGWKIRITNTTTYHCNSLFFRVTLVNVLYPLTFLQRAEGKLVNIWQLCRIYQLVMKNMLLILFSVYLSVAESVLQEQLLLSRLLLQFPIFCQ